MKPKQKVNVPKMNNVMADVFVSNINTVLEDQELLKMQTINMMKAQLKINVMLIIHTKIIIVMVKELVQNMDGAKDKLDD
jgi:hypothetical protein